jgi:hypothetical protein
MRIELQDGEKLLKIYQSRHPVKCKAKINVETRQKD